MRSEDTTPSGSSPSLSFSRNGADGEREGGGRETKLEVLSSRDLRDSLFRGGACPVRVRPGERRAARRVSDFRFSPRDFRARASVYSYLPHFSPRASRNGRERGRVRSANLTESEFYREGTFSLSHFVEWKSASPGDTRRSGSRAVFTVNQIAIISLCSFSFFLLHGDR